MPVSIKGRIILEILEGMMYLTEKNVIHKDIKPENILVDKDFHIKVHLHAVGRGTYAILRAGIYSHGKGFPVDCRSWSGHLPNME